MNTVFSILQLRPTKLFQYSTWECYRFAKIKNKVILILLPVIVKVFGNINENLIFKSTSCRQHMRKRYETVSLQGFTNASFTLSDCKVKWLSFYTIQYFPLYNLIQPNPFSTGHEIFKIVILVVRVLSVQPSEVSGMLFEIHISLLFFGSSEGKTKSIQGAKKKLPQ